MVKKFLFCGITVFLIFSLLLESVFAVQDIEKNNMGTKDLGEVPEEYHEMVNNNWAIASGYLSNDGYYSYNSHDGKVEITKHNIYGEKQYTTEYDYKYAGKDRYGFLNFRSHSVNVEYINEVGEAFVSSHVLRSVPLLKIDLPSKHNLVKIGSDGKVLWKKDFGMKEVYLIRGATQDDNGNMIFGVINKTKWVNADNNDYSVTLMKISSEGEIIKQTELREGIIFIDNLFYVENKGFFAITRELLDGSTYTSKTFLNAFDEEFNHLWEYEIDSTFDSWNNDDISKNGYPIKEKKNDAVSLSEKNTKTLTRINFDNEIVSQNTFIAKSADDRVYNIHILNNGEYVVEYRMNYQANSNKDVSFVHYSNEFKELRKLSLNSYSIHNIIETENERIFCCWNARSYDDNGNLDERECVYTAYDMNWNLLWQKSVLEKVILE